MTSQQAMELSRCAVESLDSISGVLLACDLELASHFDRVRMAIDALSGAASRGFSDADRLVEIAPGHCFDKREVRGVAKHDHNPLVVFIFLRGGQKWSISGCTYDQACARLGWKDGRKAA